jgi:hypothetical protein
MRPHITTLTTLVLAVCAALTACTASSGIDGPEDVAVTAHTLPSALTFHSNCSSTQRSRVNAAYSQIRNYIDDPSGSFLSCLKDAVFSGDMSDGLSPTSYPEEIVRRFQEADPIVIDCSACGDASCAGGETPEGELIFLHPDNITSNVSDTAGVLLHEITHNKGFAHPGPASCTGCPPDDVNEHWFALTGQVVLCFANGEGRYPQRSVMAISRENALAPVGTDVLLNAAGSSLCQTDEFVSGMTGRAADFVDRLGVVCRHRTTGADRALSAVGGAGGSSFTRVCPAGTTVIGFSGGAGEWIDRVGLRCAWESDVRAGLVNPGSQVIFSGGPGGVAWERLCPARQVVKGIRLRTTSPAANSGFVQKIDIICQDIDQPRSIAVSPKARLGGTGGASRYEEHCPSRSVMDWLRVVTAWDGVTRLGAGCSAVSNSCSGCEIGVGGADRSTLHTIAWHGGPSGGGDVATNVNCTNSNSVLIGLNVWTNEYVRAVQGICASSASGWSTGASTATKLTPIVGSTADASMAGVVCNTGSFLTGWDIKTGIFVDSITPRCRAF